MNFCGLNSAVSSFARFAHSGMNLARGIQALSSLPTGKQARLLIKIGAD